MALQPSSRTLAALAVVLLVAFSGCSAVEFGQDQSAEEISKQVEQKYEEIGTYTGTVTTEVVMGNETSTSTAEVWANQSGNELRYEYSAPESMNGTILVSNGSTMWMYNGTDNTVRKSNLSGFGAQNATPDYESIIDNFLENYNVSYEGTESVSDRSAYVLSLTPKNDSSTAQFTDEMTLWIDKETWFPVKRHSVSSFNNETIETTMTFTNLTVDADVPDDTFEFDPPSDAEVVENEMPDLHEHDTVAQADANVSFDVTAPERVPDGYELETVRTTFMGDNATASLTYQNGTDKLSVTQSNRTATIDGDDETVAIGDHDGSYAEYGSTGILRWNCDGKSYSVAGSLPKSELVTIAESIRCA
ncbi:outer membrane lipoprotein-sorting protein [Halorussus pelagicus]|uniref:outer membrane lipoprotein-sorting protein n=1 Tax=Halorussus pelagicus TaxID=2505977 RepID=UPI000FFB30FB|nr:outer membrane lipoprotein-sorting protein [Halorussus pelagicus]